MKFEGKLYGIPLYSTKAVEKGKLFLVDSANFKIKHPVTKGGQLDMRYRTNRMFRLLYPDVKVLPNDGV